MMLDQDTVATTSAKRSEAPRPRSTAGASDLPTRWQPESQSLACSSDAEHTKSSSEHFWDAASPDGRCHLLSNDVAETRDRSVRAATSWASLSSIGSDFRSSNPRSSIATNASVVSHVDRSSTRRQRAQFLFDRFGLNVTTVPSPGRHVSKTETNESLQRIQKRTRLRMHTFCHECKTHFGIGTICTKCQHRRCRLCPRAAPKGVRSLVERTKKSIELLQGAKDDFDTNRPSIYETRYDCDNNKSPIVSVASEEQVDKPPKRSSWARRSRRSTTSTPEPELRERARTVELILAAHEPSVPRPLSVRMHMDGPGSIAYQAAFARELCLTLEEAVARMCSRHDWDYAKLTELFPLSFRNLATLYKARDRQPRTFRLPRIKIRTPCSGCGQLLPGRAGSCRVCMNVGYGGGQPGSLTPVMTAY